MAMYSNDRTARLQVTDVHRGPQSQALCLLRADGSRKSAEAPGSQSRSASWSGSCTQDVFPLWEFSQRSSDKLTIWHFSVYVLYLPYKNHIKNGKFKKMMSFMPYPYLTSPFPSHLLSSQLPLYSRNCHKFCVIALPNQCISSETKDKDNLLFI